MKHKTSRFDDERAELVDSLSRKGITDNAVLAAMRVVPRHLFVPEVFRWRSYEDQALPITHNQTISQPYTVAFMTQELKAKAGDRVLEIGTGSGYQAAILAQMGCRVFSIERVYELHLKAKELLERLNYRVMCKWGDGSAGWNEFAPFKGMVVTAAAPEVPSSLIEQLEIGGNLIIPVGDIDTQSIVVVTKREEGVEKRVTQGFKFVPLVGKKGFYTQ